MMGLSPLRLTTLDGERVRRGERETDRDAERGVIERRGVRESRDRERPRDALRERDGVLEGIPWRCELSRRPFGGATSNILERNRSSFVESLSFHQLFLWCRGNFLGVELGASIMSDPLFPGPGQTIFRNHLCSGRVQPREHQSRANGRIATTNLTLPNP